MHLIPSTTPAVGAARGLSFRLSLDIEQPKSDSPGNRHAPKRNSEMPCRRYLDQHDLTFPGARRPASRGPSLEPAGQTPPPTLPVALASSRLTRAPRRATPAGSPLTWGPYGPVRTRDQGKAVAGAPCPAPGPEPTSPGPRLSVTAHRVPQRSEPLRPAQRTDVTPQIPDGRPDQTDAATPPQHERARHGESPPRAGDRSGLEVLGFTCDPLEGAGARYPRTRTGCLS